MTFRNFINSRPYTDNPLGDLARDIREDRTLPKDVVTKAELIAHLRTHAACREALKAARRLWVEYEAVAPLIAPRACRTPFRRRTDVTETIEVPREWLSRAVGLLDALAGEGIDMQGQTDPAILMVELVDHFDTGTSDDPWAAMISKLGAAP